MMVPTDYVVNVKEKGSLNFHSVVNVLNLSQSVYMFQGDLWTKIVTIKTEIVY